MLFPYEAIWHYQLSGCITAFRNTILFHTELYESHFSSALIIILFLCKRCVQIIFNSLIRIFLPVTGNKLFKSGKFREAHALYTEALEIDELNTDINSKLLGNRALVNSKIGNIRDAIADCTNALQTNPNYLKVLLLRAKCHNDMENYEECVKDYEAALKIEKTIEIKTALKDAKIALKRSKRKDYYKILGIDKRASDDEIKKAYRKRALVHHPDRHASASEDEKREQEKKFKEVGEAYAVLSDPQKKDRFDNGQDLDDVEFDPSQMYRQFFHFSGDSFGGQTFNFF